MTRPGLINPSTGLINARNVPMDLVSDGASAGASDIQDFADGDSAERTESMPESTSRPAPGSTQGIAGLVRTFLHCAAKPAAGLILAAASLLVLAEPATAADDLVIEKLVNNKQADSAPGPAVSPGSRVTFTYRVTVNNPEGLYDIQVLDSGGVVPQCDTNGDGSPDGSNVHQGPVGGGETFVCTATQLAGSTAGTTRSSGIAKASDFFGDNKFETSDPAHFTVRPATTVTAAPTTTTTQPPTTSTTATPATAAPVTASADQAAEADEEDDVDADTSAHDQPVAGEDTSDAGPTSVSRTDLLLESMVNGQDADQAPGPLFEPDEKLRWTHLLANTGESRLVEVEVTDSLGSTVTCRPDNPLDPDNGGPISMPFDLEPGQSVLCESERLDAVDDDGASNLAVLATVQADGEDPLTGAATGTISVSDPVHLQISPVDDAANADVPDELAFSDETNGEGQPGLRIPWVLVPGVVALLVGGAFLFGLVRRLEN